MAAMLHVLWVLVLLVNVLAVFVYGFDKWRSRGDANRVAERTLLWFVFCCGWLGAWLAMAWFRHKTQKQSFRRYAILWTIVNPFWLLLWWTLTPARG